MPSTLRWTGGAGDNNWQTVGNWVDYSTGSAAGAAPATGDTVYVIDGSQSITAGLSNSSVNLVGLYFGERYTGNVGTTGAPLVISVASGTPIFQYKASGAYANVQPGSSNITTAKVISTGPGELRLVGGTTTTLQVGSSAKVYVQSGAIVTTIYEAGGSLIVDSNATAITALIQEGGRSIFDRAVTTATLAGAGTLGTWINSNTIGTLHVHPGARCNYRSRGTITTANVYPGARADAQGNSAAFTVTTLNRWQGAYAWDAEEISPTIGTTERIAYA